MKNILKLMLGLAVCLPLLALAQATNLFTDATGSNVTGNPLADAGALIAALLIVGAILKNAVPQFPTRFIPLLTMVGGTIGYMLMTDSAWGSGKAWFTSLLVAASATGIHSGLKNTLQATGKQVTLLVPLCGALLLGANGCSVLSPRQPLTHEAARYQSFRALWTATLAVYDAHMDRRVASKVSPDDARDIDAAWNIFRAAFRAALDNARGDDTAFAPERVRQLADDVLTLIYAATNDTKP